MPKVVSIPILFLNRITHAKQRKDGATQQQSAPRAISSVSTKWQLTGERRASKNTLRSTHLGEPDKRPRLRPEMCNQLLVVQSEIEMS